MSPAKLIIQRDRVTTENSNNPHGMGLLRPDDFAPSAARTRFSARSQSSV